MLGCLEAIAARAMNDGTLDTASAAGVLTFFRVFADRCHHGQEVRLLFPQMESQGFFPTSGPTGGMRREHQEGRQHVVTIAEAAALVSAGGKPGEVSAGVSCRSTARIICIETGQSLP